MTLNSTVQFDPSKAVPDEYDAFCLGCGYSLVGLSQNRCPECGLEFDPNNLAFARIPWLYRNRLGTFRAYFRTAVLISFHPARFAREMLRPNAISVSDAKIFRSVTLWIAAAAFALVVLVLPIVALQNYLSDGRGAPPIGWLVHGTFATLLAIGVFRVYLWMATDMPLFIWKGLSRTQLAPIHHYASAPLAFLPVAGAAFSVWFYILLSNLFRLDPRFILVAMTLSLGFVAWLILVAIILMAISMKAGIGRQLLLAIYLPFHWIAMFAVSVSILFLGVGIEHLLTGTRL